MQHSQPTLEQPAAAPLAPPPPPASAPRRSLLSGRLLAANVGWNLLGQLLPGVVALVATPIIVHGYGDVRFGLLTLAWLVVGYFSLFDFGLGRAVTHAIAEAITSHEDARITDVFWTSIYLLAVLGLVGMVVLGAASPWIVGHLLHTPATLAAEARTVFLILALSVPLVVLATGIRGVLEGAQAFAWANAIRIPIGVLGFLIPVVALRFSHSLVPTIWGLLVMRLVSTTAMGWAVMRVLPAVRRVRPFARASASALMRFGAWITVSNIVSPLMVSMDRFVVGSLMSLAMVTYYATPFEAVSRLLIIPGAIGSVIFPALASAHSIDRDRMLRIYRVAGRVIFSCVFPAALVIVCFAPELLHLWLGGAFPDRSSSVLRWLTVGIAINAVAYVPYALVQSMGRSDLTAKAHLIELASYVGMLFALIKFGGIAGAAAAWTIRVTLDCALLVTMAMRVAKQPLRPWLAEYAPMAALLAAAFALSLIPSVGMRAAAGLALGLIFAVVAWRRWLRELAHGGFQALIRRGATAQG